MAGQVPPYGKDALFGRAGFTPPFKFCVDSEDNKMELCKKIVDELQKEIISFPEGFYDTFKFTTTGKNLTHPRTIGILCKILWKIKGISSVYIDRRFNVKERKFQPDIVAFNKNDKPIIYLDYESPNSSDARLMKKDIKAYANWVKIKEYRAPYLIITTLPNKKPEAWQYRYFGGYNYPFRRKRKQIKENPFRFWYSHYRDYVNKNKCSNIFFANINGKAVELIKM